MKNFKKTVVTLTISTILSGSAYAADNIVAIGPKMGTQGLGLEGRAPITESLFGRLGVNYASASADKQIDAINGLQQSVKLTLFTVPVMLDWHPFDDSGFRLSGGVAYNGNEIKTKASSIAGATINGTAYTAAQIGSVEAKLKLGGPIAGLATLGYDSSFISNSAWSFNFEAGVMYSGSPKLSVSSTGTSGEAVRKDLEDSFNNTSKDAKNLLRIYPVLSLGFKYKF